MRNFTFSHSEYYDDEPRPASHFVGRPMRGQGAANDNPDNPEERSRNSGGHPPADLPQPGGTGPSEPARGWAWRLAAIPARLLGRCRFEFECARAIRELNQFDDKCLRDIGIEDRSEIEHLVRYGHRRD